MANDALAEILTAEKVPEILIAEIGKALTLKSFAMLVDKPCNLEAALHSGLPASAADSITPFVLAGLKAAWAQALKTCASQGPPIALASTGASSSEAATISSWSDAFPAKLSATFTKEIRLRFESSYPGELLDDSSMPSSRLLALAHRYKTDCTYKFIPWKLRLSERAQEELTAFRPRKMPKLEDLMYDEVPSRDIPDNGISQMLLYSLLDLAASAFTMLEAAHLASFRAYNRLFVKLAFRRHTAESGLRGPSVAEMQAADKEAWRVIGDLTSKGWSLDDALHEVVEVRCLLHSELQARALPPQSFPSCSQAVGGVKVVARAKALSQAPRSSLHGSLHLWTHLTRSMSFANSSICAVVALVKIASSCTSAALTRILSLAWVTTPHTNMWTSEDARDLQGRRRPGRWHCLPFLWSCLRRCMSQTLLRWRVSLFPQLLLFM